MKVTCPGHVHKDKIPPARALADEDVLEVEVTAVVTRSPEKALAALEEGARRQEQLRDVVELTAFGAAWDTLAKDLLAPAEALAETEALCAGHAARLLNLIEILLNLIEILDCGNFDFMVLLAEAFGRCCGLESSGEDINARLRSLRSASEGGQPALGGHAGR